MRESGISLDVRTDFGRELKRRVDAYFETQGVPKHGGKTMVRKAVAIFAWLGASWTAMLVSFAVFELGWLVSLAFAVSAGLAMAAIGMAVQHDGGHAAFAGSKQGNRRAAVALDFLGASSYVWKAKHGHIHHTYPNIVGTDDDISLEPLARMAPGQPRRGYHRFQQLYMWFLYCFIGIKWWLFDDFVQVHQQKIGETPLAKPKGNEALIFWGMKVVHGIWGVVIPVLVVGWLPAIVFYVTAQFVMGITLAVVFQLAHCVEEAEFLVPEHHEGHLRLDFSAHQLATTVDFAQDSKLISWFVGGLNFQAEHHLFPRISHIHYPAIAPIVRQTCAEFGVPYKVHASLGSALRSHYRWLRHLGREDGVGHEPRLAQSAELARAA